MFSVAVFLVLVIIASGPALADEPVLRATMNENGVLVSQGQRPVLVYQRTPKSVDGKWTRANYVHPLHDLDGKVITEDFPSDHRHHRGIFWAWHQVWLGDKRLGDPWVCTDFVWDVRSVQYTSPASPLSLRAEVQWKSPRHVSPSGEMIPVVSECVIVTAYAAESSYRLIDFDIHLRALVSGIKIGGSEDAKGYGGFSPRIKLAGDERFLTGDGEVEPLKTAIENAGAWVNIVGKDSGLVMVCHPDNPSVTPSGDPNWILRRSRSMQNAVYPGRDPVELSRESPTRLRYRLIVHDGTLSSDQIAAISQQYRGTGVQRPTVH